MDEKEYFISSAKVLFLGIQVDHNNILKEAINLKDKFLNHKAKPFLHQGWKSICLHGISEKHIDTWGDYGFKTAQSASDVSMWTSISQLCPHTLKFLNKFPCKKYGRVRFELLEPNGFIDECQTPVPSLETIIIPLSSPGGSKLIWADNEELTFNEGSVMSVNTYYSHKLINNSNDDRYHLIIDRHDSTTEWKSLIDTACVEQNIIGEYITHTLVT